MTGRVLVSLNGLVLSEAEKELISHPSTAGVVLFTRNYSDKEQLKNLVAAIQVFSNKDDLPIFVDQEGGQIQRFRENFTKLESFYDLGKNPNLIPQHAEKLAKEMLEFGLISLTPVVDLDLGNSVISGKERSFSSNPDKASKLAKDYIRELKKYGHSSTLKHFPGHGQLYENGNDDSHFCLPIDNRELNTIVETDLIPFIENLSTAEAIMPAHILYPNVDPNNTVGYSKIWIQEILREKYNYKGIVVSDCLSMAGAGNESMLQKTNNSLEIVDIAIMCNISATLSLEVLNNIENGTLNPDRKEFFDKWASFGKETRKSLRTSNAPLDITAHAG
jgi:beta-N-acetylhexosaminidase